MDGVIIDPGHCWLIKIGDNVTLAPRVLILAHDASTKMPIGYTKLGMVVIGNNVFIGAGTIVLPNTIIADNVIVGAGSVVSTNLSSGIYYGNPCKKVSEYSEWVEKQELKMLSAPVYDISWTTDFITDSRKEQMRYELEGKIGFVK